MLFDDSDYFSFESLNLYDFGLVLLDGDFVLDLLMFVFFVFLFVFLVNPLLLAFEILEIVD